MQQLVEFDFWHLPDVSAGNAQLELRLVQLPKRQRSPLNLLIVLLPPPPVETVPPSLSQLVLIISGTNVGEILTSVPPAMLPATGYIAGGDQVLLSLNARSGRYEKGTGWRFSRSVSAAEGARSTLLKLSHNLRLEAVVLGVTQLRSVSLSTVAAWTIRLFSSLPN